MCNTVKSQVSVECMQGSLLLTKSLVLMTTVYSFIIKVFENVGWKLMLIKKFATGVLIKTFLQGFGTFLSSKQALPTTDGPKKLRQDIIYCIFP